MVSTLLEPHSFAHEIMQVIEHHFGEQASTIFDASPLLGYLCHKTKAANRGSKARASLANHYALYVLVEDYIAGGFADGSSGRPYREYEGARFSDLLLRQRELPFGTKLQNHALNSRLNDEFRKYYPSLPLQPVVRDVVRQLYWIQEALLHVEISGRTYNLASAVIAIIDRYVAVRKAAFENFLESCRAIQSLASSSPDEAITFIARQLQPEVDARIFEIVSFAILKAKYGRQIIWIGALRESVVAESLRLYKTGRTNANDGGIDFVMRPLGRFFQVTETVHAGKYFLDIDKVQRYPMTFVVKSAEPADAILSTIRQQAMARYNVEAVVASYMAAIEEVINTHDLLETFEQLVASGCLSEIMNEIIVQSRVEFNYPQK